MMRLSTTPNTLPPAKQKSLRSSSEAIARHTSAFTLIELSIVLVIIGLVLGGLLVGKDMIEAAELRKIGTDYQQYNATILTFRNKYNCLAGDCPSASQLGIGSNGDGDGRIDYDAIDNTILENIYIWAHLSNAGLLSQQYTGTATTTCFASNPCYIPGINVPKNGDFDAMYTFYNFPSNSTAWAGHLAYQNVMIMGTVDSSATVSSRWHMPTLNTLQQRSLDVKYDDGLPYSGVIIDIRGGANYTPNCTTSEVVSSAQYNVSFIGKACVLMWKAQF